MLKARTNSKILWDFTRDISGRTKKKDEIVYIYINGEKNLELVWRLFIETWKREIYQKVTRMDLTFWYGSENKIGLKETMRRRDNRK